MNRLSSRCCGQNGDSPNLHRRSTHERRLPSKRQQSYRRSFFPLLRQVSYFSPRVENIHLSESRRTASVAERIALPRLALAVAERTAKRIFLLAANCIA